MSIVEELLHEGDGRFVRIPNFLVRSNQLSFGEKVVLLVILSHSFGKRCLLKHETVAKEAGTSKSTVKRNLYSLRNKGVLTWSKTSFGRCNEYFISRGLAELISDGTEVTTEPAISPAETSQSDHQRANENKTTTENDLIKRNERFKDFKEDLIRRGILGKKIGGSTSLGGESSGEGGSRANFTSSNYGL